MLSFSFNGYDAFIIAEIIRKLLGISDFHETFKGQLDVPTVYPELAHIGKLKWGAWLLAKRRAEMLI